MSKLKETKNYKYHYYLDDKNRYQGEYRQQWSDKQSWHRSVYKDDLRHGEAKWWTRSGLCSEHQFYQNNINITKEVKELVKDFNNITHKERVLIKLKFGIECLS